MSIIGTHAEVELKINAILPPRYQHCYSEVQPNSMGSASLKYDSEGKVVWDQIWTSFCDLAIAGGPPHRGKLLEPAKFKMNEQNQQQYQVVEEELSRAIGLVAYLTVTTTERGWIGVNCDSPTMAAWLTCAIIAENVSAYRKGKIVYLPVGPSFRVEKEIKNIVTALAKTCHYWSSHGPSRQENSVFTTLLSPVTFCQRVISETKYQSFVSAITASLKKTSGWNCDSSLYFGWIGVQCPTVEIAIWLMRVLIVSGILVRREDSVLHLPTGDGTAQQMDMVIEAFHEAILLWKQRADQS